VENFMEQSEDQGNQRKRYWIKILKKSDAWKLLRNKTPQLLQEFQKGDADNPDGQVGIRTRSYYPLLKHLTLDLSLVDMENEESRRVFFTKIVPRLASKAEVPVKEANLAFGYALRRFEGGYSPQAVRLFMPPLEKIDTEYEFNSIVLKVERRIVRVVGLQRWRVRNMLLYKNFLQWLKANLNGRYVVGDLWDKFLGNDRPAKKTRMCGFEPHWIRIESKKEGELYQSSHGYPRFRKPSYCFSRLLLSLQYPGLSQLTP
jgi:hypothetical protein